jgi:hypothetical protein
MSQVPDPTDRLNALGGMTQEFEEDNPTPEQAQASQAQAAAVAAEVDGARDWGMMMFAIGGLVCMAAPELTPVYSEDRCLTWGKHMHQVSQKYGWDAPSSAPEFGLAAASIGFVVPTYLVLSQKIAEAKAAKKSVLSGLFYWWKTRKGSTSQEKQPATNGSEP